MYPQFELLVRFGSDISLGPAALHIYHHYWSATATNHLVLFIITFHLTDWFGISSASALQRKSITSSLCTIEWHFERLVNVQFDLILFIMHYNTYLRYLAHHCGDGEHVVRNALNKHINSRRFVKRI